MTLASISVMQAICNNPQYYKDGITYKTAIRIIAEIKT